MRVMLWHVHGSWTTAFVQGPHEYLIPVLPDRGPDGRGRAQTWDWPANTREIPPDQLPDDPPDVVILQRPHEGALVAKWLGMAVGKDIPAVYLEHNTPAGEIGRTRHPMADQRTIRLVHVTAFNELIWDNGLATTSVIEHGVLDPGPLYTGEIPHVALAVNEPVRRGRIVGTDLISRFAEVSPIDVYGMGVRDLIGSCGLDPQRVIVHENLVQRDLHVELARRRAYLHLPRWTSLGLALIEAMHLGMPVVAIASTDVVEAVPSEAGVVSTSLDRLCQAVRGYREDPESARLAGKAARDYALARYGLNRFLADWDRLLEEVVR
jgi:hypothetical protein